MNDAVAVSGSAEVKRGAEAPQADTADRASSRPASRIEAPTLEQLELRLSRQEALIRNLRFQAEDVPFLKSKVRKLEASIAGAREIKLKTDAELAGRYSELALITSALLKEEARSSQLHELASKAAQIVRVIAQPEPWWVVVTPKSWRRARLRRRLEARGLFNARGYAEQFPDVIFAGHDPFRHFLTHGLGEMLEGKR